MTGHLTMELINTGTFVRDYTCMTFSKNNEDFLFAGTSSGDLIGFQTKTKAMAFSINFCAMGVRTIQAVSADRIIAGGGDGQVVLFKTNGKDTVQSQKIQIFGAIHGLSVSPDGL